MPALEEFSRKIEARLVAAWREPLWQASQSAQFMAQIGRRRSQFDEIASRLVNAIIRPRLQTVASYFPNAAPDRAERSDRGAYWFGYCERFPADVRVEFAIEHDTPIEQLIIHYELYIMPVFLKFEPHDKLTMPLGTVNDQAVADWVESKLLDFIDTYLRLDRGKNDSRDAVVVDPVCGMRIDRSSAGATMDYRGHPYYFCTEECRQRFAKEPMQYIRFETE